MGRGLLKKIKNNQKKLEVYMHKKKGLSKGRALGNVTC